MGAYHLLFGFYSVHRYLEIIWYSYLANLTKIKVGGKKGRASLYYFAIFAKQP